MSQTVRALRTLRRASSGVAAAPTGTHMRIVSINDVYELHALPRLKSLIDEQKPQIVTLVQLCPHQCSSALRVYPSPRFASLTYFWFG